jgi:formylglycine-generating enzyme required for sulfatase activity
MKLPTSVGQVAGEVLRGGSYNNNQNNAACAYRNNNNPNNNFNNNVGFRVVVAPMPFFPFRGCNL